MERDADFERTTYRRASTTGSARTQGRTVVFDAQRGKYRGLEGVGARIWELLDDGANATSIAAALASDYDAPETQLRADASRFLRSLWDQGLVTTAGAGVAPPRVATCAWVLASVRMALRALGIGRTLAVARHAALGKPKGAASSDVLSETARVCASVAALMPARLLCLEQSVAIYVLLRRAGIDARLCLGVQPFVFGAHAWVEHRGVPVNDTREGLKPYLVTHVVED